MYLESRYSLLANQYNYELVCFMAQQKASMSMGTRGSTIGTMRMLTICFDLIIMNITEVMMRRKNLMMVVMSKFNVSGFQAERNDPAVKMIHTQITS